MRKERRNHCGYFNDVVTTFEGTDKEDEVEAEVYFEISPFVPGRMWLDNGDPGYPDEGNELELFEVKRLSDQTDITHEVGLKETLRLVEKCYQQKNSDYGSGL
jgi:hypothetical protein